MADTLDKLIAIFRDSKISVKIGILENSARHIKNDEGAVADEGNADIGAIHEFGGWSSGARIPRRSFLRMPLTLKFKGYVKSADITEETLKRAVKEDNLMPMANKLARAAKECVDEAFETGGFGIWPPHSPLYHSETGKLLDDTGQLKAAISTKVEEK